MAAADKIESSFDAPAKLLRGPFAGIIGEAIKDGSYVSSIAAMAGSFASAQSALPALEIFGKA